MAPGVPESTSDVSVDVTVTTDHESAAMLAQSLAVHGQAINTGQYDVAFDLFTPSLQEQMEGLETWRQGLISTFWRELQVADVRAQVFLPFSSDFGENSTFAPTDGATRTLQTVFDQVVAWAQALQALRA